MNGMNRRLPCGIAPCKVSAIRGYGIRTLLCYIPYAVWSKARAYLARPQLDLEAHLARCSYQSHPLVEKKL